MALNFNWAPPGKETAWRGETITIDAQDVPVIYRRNDRAKRYRLMVGRDGFPRVTIPRRGSLKAAAEFADAHRTWLKQQLNRFQNRQRQKVWTAGTPLWFRGQQHPLQLESNGAFAMVRWAAEKMAVPLPAMNLRPAVELYLKELAAEELPVRARQLAEVHQLNPRKIIVRAQVSRWGSCSRQGTISLNWRLIQVPESVRDYVIVHELMHLRQMNHSVRFWTLIMAACPDFKTSEAWLREHSQALL